MIKKSLITSTYILSSLMMTGCFNSSLESENTTETSLVNTVNLDNIKIDDFTEFKTNEEVDENGYHKINGYKNLKSLDMKYTIKDIKHLSLPSAKSEPKIFYNTGDKVKSLLGKNVEVVPYKINDNIQTLYALKGYEEKVENPTEEKRYIYLNLKDKYDEKFGYPVSEKISFASQASSLEKSLKYILSMEDKIKIMLDNLMKKEYSNEVLKFLREEISRINKSEITQSAYTIDVDQDTYIEFSYIYDEGYDMHYCRLSLHCKIYNYE